MPPCDDPEYDRLYKEAFVVNNLKRRFAEEFTPHQEVAVDMHDTVSWPHQLQAGHTAQVGYEGLDAG